MFLSLSRAFRDRIRFIANPVYSPRRASSQLKAGHGKGRTRKAEREKERAACNLRGGGGGGGGILLSFIPPTLRNSPPHPAFHPFSSCSISRCCCIAVTRRCFFRCCCYLLPYWLVVREIVVVPSRWKWRRKWCLVSRLPFQARESRTRVTHFK